MTESVSRELVDAFYKAHVAQNNAKLAAILHDDVTWVISGPVAILNYCGIRRGKAAVLDLFGNIIPKLFRVVSFVQDSVLIDADRVATLNRMSARRCDDGRMISYRLAHFMRFHDGKMIENMALIDSFDAVEQVLGHPLSVPGQAPAGDGELFAV